MSLIVATDHLTKRYGARAVVEELDLRVPEGSIYGFLGPNGSGKSTTMKMLLSLVRPTSGRVEILGRPMERSTRHGLLREMGSLIESPPGYAHLTGRENLRIVQRQLDLRDDQVARAVGAVRMDSQLDKRVGHYSLGMKQRLGIAMALAREPRLLILDEPTNGLDPAGIEEIRGLLRTLADQGITVLVSSHLLGEIDRTATVLGILSQGRLLFQGSRAELLATSRPDLLIDTDDPVRAGETLAGLAPRAEGRTLRIPGLDEESAARVIATLVGEGVPVFEARRDEQSLERVFMDLTAGGAL